jgi:hypothetical protein
MLVARWSIDAKFGYKQSVIEAMQKWLKEIGPQAGFDAGRTRLLTGSVGARESTIVTEHLVEDLNELSRVWDKLGSIPAHKEWSKSLEPHVVSGTNKWEIYRIL